MTNREQLSPFRCILLFCSFCSIALFAFAIQLEATVIDGQDDLDYDNSGDNGDNYRRLAASLDENETPMLWGMSNDELEWQDTGVCALEHPPQRTLKEESAQLAEIVEMFEQALDHLAKTAEYATKLRPFIKDGQVRDFERSGGLSGLRISQDRRELMEKYKSSLAKGASQIERNSILGEFYYKACASKLSMVIAEGSMFEAMLKIGSLQEKEGEAERQYRKEHQHPGLRGVKMVENYFQ